MRGHGVKFVWSLTTAVLCLALITFLVGELVSVDGLLAREIAFRQAQLAASRQPVVLYNAGTQDVSDRWFGSPAIYQPAPIGNTTIEYFDIIGTSQGTIELSLNNSDICKRYGPCAKDPANPGGIAWGLEWFQATVSSYVCYSPSTTTIPFHQYILLPRWAPRADGTVTTLLIQRWNALAQTIYIHEAGHVAIDKTDLAALNAQAHRLPTCAALFSFWDSPHLYDRDEADQAAYHARLRADCRPEIGCIPAYWMGW